MTPVRRPVLVFVLFCLCAIVAVMVLRPGDALRREADLAAAVPTSALAELGGYVAYGPDEQAIAQMHAQLALGAGDFDLARNLLADLAANFPDDASLWDLLAHTEIVAGDFTTASTHLARAYGLDPTKPRRDRLGLLYRVLDRQPAEAALLVDAPVHELSMAELDRAVALLLAADRADEVIDLYLRHIAEGSAHAEMIKQKLVVFLIDIGRSDDARAYAISWIEHASQGGALSSDLVRSFIARGAIDSALTIAAHQMANGSDGMGQIVLRFAESGHGALARKLQSDWLAQAEDLSEDDWSALSQMAARTGDLSGLRSALFHHQTPAPAMLGEALLQFLRYYGPQALLPFRAHMGEDLSEAAPLVGAGFALEMSHPETAARLLARAKAEGLGPRDQLVWQSLADRLARQGAGVAIGEAY